MNELSLIKSEHFGEIEADIYTNGADLFMTINQLSECLEYADKRAVEKLLERNEYLKKEEFSFIQKVPYTAGGTQKTRTFTEDGIYEVTMLSTQPKAKEFRTWVRGILKALRSGKAKLVGMTEYQQMLADTRRNNVAVQKARLLNQIAAEYDGTYKQVLQAHATKELTGEFLLPLPEIKAKTYTAKEIADKLGITANMVGILTNRHGLKTEQYGAWYNDKAKHNNKEAPSFRYYETIISAKHPFLDGLRRRLP